jgi:orotidine-5'-phosphate decarboxylase
MNRPLIVALDFPSSKEALSLVEKLSICHPFVKVGMELFYKEGPAIIEQLKNKNCHIFLDLKLHDIPNTVKQAMKQLAKLEIDIVNVHAAGGQTMMEAALEGLEAGTSVGRKRPSCIAVTQLTSTTERMLKEELLVPSSIDSTIKHYATIAQKSGLDGVVCSALEVPMIKEVCGKLFLTVTPGIRNIEDKKHDQHRIVSPKQANQLGSDAIVVGRSITQAKDPHLAYLRMKNDWEGLL